MDPTTPLSPSDLKTLGDLLSSGGNVAMIAAVWVALKVKGMAATFFADLKLALVAVAETNKAQTRAVEELYRETQALRAALVQRGTLRVVPPDVLGG